MYRLQHNISVIVMMIIAFCTSFSTEAYCQSIVYAGPDSGFCEDNQFDLSVLNASIIGQVDDGTWISSGDGIFMPDNSGNGQLSISEYYIPGPLDLQTGVFNLSLVSDEDPNSGLVFTDQAFIYLIGDVFPFCNAFLNVSLSEECETYIDYLQLVVNPNYPIDLFEITLYDINGNEIPDQIVTVDHIGTTIQYEAMHTCSGQSCNGNIQIYDHYVPQPDCRDTTVSCLTSVIPDTLGFPIVTDSIPVQLDDFNYFVENGDNCTNLHMHFHDSYSDELCSSPYETIISRHWTLTDDYGNESSCTQTISVLRAGLNDVNFPGDFDGMSNPPILCSDTIPLDQYGNPHPEFTGMPDAMYCQYLQSTYSDITFDFCGETKKINREWHIIEWCSNESISMFQLIVLVDTIGPEILCLDTLTIPTNPYTCETFITPIEVPNVVDNCGDAIISAKLKDGNLLIEQWFDFETDSLQIPALPLGFYNIEWTAIDECGNDTTCLTVLEVEDMSKPFAVCIQDTKVAINTFGFARVNATSIDNGSYDNCSLSHVEIRTLNDACLGETEFSDFVDLCCENVGTVVRVEMRVTDHVGLTNYCEVNILVEDKLAPEITCPSDLTLSCEYYSNLHDINELGIVYTHPDSVTNIIIYDAINDGIVGQDGFMMDNCSAAISDTIIENIDCDEGTVLRRFFAEDDFGNIDSCTQTITIVNSNAIDFDAIDWPESVVLDTCFSEELGEAYYGVPLWANPGCSMISFSHQDQLFEFTDGACVKIIRTFTLIDWCQFDGTNNEGIWDYEQIIKFENHIAPEFDNECGELDLCLTSDSCTEIFVFSISATDDCTDVEALSYTFELIDTMNQAIIAEGLSNSFELDLMPGVYFIKWVVEDKCGNSNVCQQLVNIVDCKSPSPYCVGSVTLVMNQDGEANLWISDVDLGGSDNCTNQQDLLLSFDEFIVTQSVSYNCDDIENGVQDTVYQDLWYIDGAGNKEYCSAMIILQDNQNYCPNNFASFNLNGTTLNSSINVIGDIHIDLVSNDESYLEYQYSPNGEFAFQELPSDLNYQLHLHRDDSFLIGVSTLDIFTVQNHILGLNPLDSPYDVIAADVDGSQSVSGIDLVTMRKLILGKIVEFPNTESPWKFVKRDDELANINPWFLSEVIDVESDVGQDLYMDIMAIKVGDVNGTIQNLTNNDVAYRSSESIGFHVIESQLDEVFEYQFFISGEMSNMYAFQLDVNIGSNRELFKVSSSIFSDFSNEHYHILNDNELRISYNTSIPVNLKESDVLLTFRSTQKLELELLSNISSEIVTDKRLYGIDELELLNQVVGEGCFVFDHHELSGGQLMLYFDPNNDLPEDILVFDLMGNLYTLNASQSAENVLTLNVPSDLGLEANIFILHLKSNTCSYTEKIFLSSLK